MGALIDWEQLENPVLAYEDWSLKDACVLYHQDTFHVFSSAFSEERSTLIYVTTKDWCEFSEFKMHLTGGRLNATGVCSPSILEAEGRFVLSFNTWGQGRRNQLYVIQTSDFVHWSDIRPLAPALTRDRRCIDVALAYREPHWIAVWREGNTPRFAYSEALDGQWDWIGDGTGSLRTAGGFDNAAQGMLHENFQLIEIDGTPHLLVTDYDPHHPWLYRMAGDPAELEAWTMWQDGYRLMIPSQRFNAIPKDLPSVRNRDFRRPLVECWDDPGAVHILDGLDNAAFLCDWRAYDGSFTLLYAGKNEVGRNRFNGTAGKRTWPRGWNRLGLARSRDLRTWVPAGR